jgi:hypothetical protein
MRQPQCRAAITVDESALWCFAGSKSWHVLLVSSRCMQAAAGAQPPCVRATYAHPASSMYVRYRPFNTLVCSFCKHRNHTPAYPKYKPIAAVLHAPDLRAHALRNQQEAAVALSCSAHPTQHTQPCHCPVRCCSQQAKHAGSDKAGGQEQWQLPAPAVAEQPEEAASCKGSHEEQAVGELHLPRLTAHQAEAQHQAVCMVGRNTAEEREARQGRSSSR